MNYSEPSPALEPDNVCPLRGEHGSEMICCCLLHCRDHLSVDASMDRHQHSRTYLRAMGQRAD